MKHLKKNNETYLNHLLFASKVGLVLLFRGLLFLVHGLAPISAIPRKWNLEETALQLFEWSNDRDGRKK